MSTETAAPPVRPLSATASEQVVALSATLVVSVNVSYAAGIKSAVVAVKSDVPLIVPIVTLQASAVAEELEVVTTTVTVSFSETVPSAVV
jgi:hypothetical protein